MSERKSTKIDAVINYLLVIFTAMCVLASIFVSWAFIIVSLFMIVILIMIDLTEDDPFNIFD